MRWKAMRGDELRTGLTIVQLEALVAAGELAPDDLVRPEATRDGGESRWRRVCETPYLRRAIPSRSAPATMLPISGPLSDEAIVAFLATESDAPRMQRIRRISDAVRIGAACLLALEAWLLVKAVLDAP